jgi:hypothetical protein
MKWFLFVILFLPTCFCYAQQFDYEQDMGQEDRYDEYETNSTDGENPWWVNVFLLLVLIAVPVFYIHAFIKGMMGS